MDVTIIGQVTEERMMMHMKMMKWLTYEENNNIQVNRTTMVWFIEKPNAY